MFIVVAGSSMFIVIDGSSMFIFIANVEVTSLDCTVVYALVSYVERHRFESIRPLVLTRT